MRAESRWLMLGAALVLSGLPATATEDSPAVEPQAARRAVVKCPGVTGIPYTADEEQALPMRVIGTLTCGDMVTVLSDREGYTAQIRTKDGHEGYVALMYLAMDSSAPAMAAQKAEPVSANPVNGVVRWQAGAPGCDAFVSHGRHVESITAGGITVQVSLQDSGWKYRANVAVSNHSAEIVEVLPGIITLDELEPNLRSLSAVEPKKLAHTPTHQVFWTQANAVPPASAVISGNGAERERAENRSATADYLNPHLALTSARQSGFARTETIDVAAVALKTTNVPAGQVEAGVMWYERDASAKELSLRVPVGNLVFDFAFSLEEKK